MSSPLFGVGLLNSIMFGVYGNSFRVLSQKNSKPIVINASLSGSCAGVIACFVITPLDLIKIRLQVQRGYSVYKGPFDCIKQIVKNDGFSGLFRGFVLTVLRDVPGYTAYFGAYECCKSKLGHSPPALLISGGLAGIASWLVSYPQDVIKSRMQSNPLKKDGTPKYINGLDCVRKSFQKEGISVFFRGLTVTCIRTFPKSAVTFFVYEVCCITIILTLL